MRYQVPQFVDIEDKVIGPFTVKQFLMYIVAAMLLVPVYLTSDISLFVTIAIPVIGIAAAFAHVRIHGKSLFSMIGYSIQFISRGQLFLWRRTSKPKLLAVKGSEYEIWQEDLKPLVSETTSLAQQSRILTAGGSIVGEDLEDPFETTPNNNKVVKKNKALAAKKEYH